MFSKTLLDLKSFEEEQGITTSSHKLDTLFTRGVPFGVITEFCGEPGCGKTQICIQLCVNVQLPKNGNEKTAVFIDTSYGFNPNRLKDITIGQKENVKLIADNIHLAYITSVVELLAAICHLKQFCDTNPNVKLIVIDSISYLFREVPYNGLEKLRILYQIINDLQYLATKFHLAVVVTNDVTTKIERNNTSKIVPALGESYGHRISQRVLLTKLLHEPAGHFAARLVKSSRAPMATVKFRVDKTGISDSD